MNRPIHFEIHAMDPARAASFYEAVFGWSVQKWDMPGVDYWAVMTGQDEPGAQWHGINGGLILRKGPPPTEENQPVNGYVCTIDVASIDATAAKIVEHGGVNALPKQPIPGMGWLAYYKDTESNIFGIMESDPNAK